MPRYLFLQKSISIDHDIDRTKQVDASIIAISKFGQIFDMYVVSGVILDADAESGIHFTIRALLKPVCSKNSFQMKMFEILLVLLKLALNVVYSQF